jgi:O-antigen ligase
LKISLVKLKETLEWGFVFFVLQLSTGAVVVILLSSGADEGAVVESTTMQAVWFGIYVISLGLILLRARQFISVAKRDLLLLLLVGIAVFSYHWSIAPPLTVRRSIALMGSTLFGMYVATCYSPKQILKLVVWTLSIGALLSVVLGLALPSYGIAQGGWRGIYQHKNFMGRLMSLNAVFLLLLNSGNRRYRWLVSAGIGLSAGLVLLSNSKGAWVTFLALLILLPFFKALQWKYTLAIPILIIMTLVSAVGGVWIAENLEDIVVNKLGKNFTFTGRTELWELVIEMIKQRPLLGYGYSAFWLGLNGPSGYIQLAAGWAVPHAHNGFLDLWLDLGFLGLLVFILGFLISVIRAIRSLCLTKKVEDIWPLIFLTCTLLYNLAESTILERNNFFWILYVATVLSRPVLHNSSKKS